MPRRSPAAAPAVPSLSPWLAVGLLGVAGLVACISPEAARKDADDEVFGLILERRAELFGQSGEFHVDPPADSLRQMVLRGEVQELQDLGFLDCLRIAAENNRSYQDSRERLYLTALDLTLERWRFGNRYTATGDATLTGDGGGADQAGAGGDLTLARVLGSGATIAADIGASLFRLVSTGDGWDALSSLGLSITQPLLRGAGREIVLEPLTQAERNLVYEVRGYERFRRTFAVDVADRFYRLLQTMDQVANQEANARSLEILRRRNEAHAEAGLLSDIQVDQARQDELSSRDSLVRLHQGLEAQLDNFKIFLGLPVEVELSLDTGEQERLALPEEVPLETLGEDRLADFALSHRLDYLTVADTVADAERQVRITADALRLGLDLELSTGATSEEGRPLAFRSRNLPWSLGLSYDLPVDRLPERNAFRASLVNLQAALRNMELFQDQIRANIRDLVRQVAANRETWNIQKRSVELAERRVESARLNLQAGRSSTRDVLEAERALLSAQNAATRALIDFSLASLRLYNEMELLEVDEEGVHVDEEGLAELLGRTDATTGRADDPEEQG